MQPLLKITHTQPNQMRKKRPMKERFTRKGKLVRLIKHWGNLGEGYTRHPVEVGKRNHVESFKRMARRDPNWSWV